MAKESSVSVDAKCRGANYYPLSNPILITIKVSSSGEREVICPHLTEVTWLGDTVPTSGCSAYDDIRQHKERDLRSKLLEKLTIDELKEESIEPIESLDETKKRVFPPCIQIESK